MKAVKPRTPEVRGFLLSSPVWLLLLPMLAVVYSVMAAPRFRPSPAASPRAPFEHAAAQEAVEARNIILFIGDGMGEAQRTAARWMSAGITGTLVMDRLPVSGWLATQSADNEITDSAASATAMATGTKTNNGMVGQSASGQPLVSILALAQSTGRAVGLVTNVQVSHATPAAFAAHVPNRSMMTEIARQLASAQLNVLLGGGEDEFLPTDQTGCFPEPGERTDSRNLLVEAADRGYTIVCSGAELLTVDPAATDYLIGLFADEGMQRPYSPSLLEMTEKALEILSKDPDGFFLMVEGGQIDWAGHANQATNMISDVISFDEAVAAGVQFAEGEPGTLVIVTADHETGGMSLDSGAGQDGPFLMPDGTPFYVNWSTTGHTAADVPVSADGPNSHLLTGSNQNTQIFFTMLSSILLNRQFLPVVQSHVPDEGRER